jgi:hypothetical protein
VERFSASQLIQGKMSEKYKKILDNKPFTLSLYILAEIIRWATGDLLFMFSVQPRCTV